MGGGANRSVYRQWIRSLMPSEAQGKTIFNVSLTLVLFMDREAGHSSVGCWVSPGEGGLGGKRGLNEVVSLLLAGAPGLGWEAAAS